MTYEELVKRLRSWAKDIQEGSTAIYAMDLDLKNAASSIEALTAENKRLGQQCEGLMQAGMNNGQALIIAEAKLATCEKYRDAYAECDKIGTQAVRDLEAKLAKALAGLDKAAALIEDRHVVHMTSKGRNPKDYISDWSLIAKEVRALLAEIEGEKT
jgi:hypothetical protein